MQIECAYFNVLTKTKTNLDFEKSYSLLKQMVKQSYEEQALRRFKGNFTQEEPLLTKKIAKTIYIKNKKQIENSELSQNM